jgi:hypothetical protein
MGLEQLVKREQKFLKHHAGGSVASKKFREWLSDMGTTQADAAKKKWESLRRCYLDT